MVMNKIIYKTYLDKAYVAYSKINTLVSNDNKRLLKDIYVPMTLVSDNKISGSRRIIVVDGMPEDFDSANQRILIVDRAGMGKSTLIKRMFVDLCEKGERLPIYIELRRIATENTLLKYVEEMLSLTEQGKETLTEDLKEGNVVLFFDGFDEVRNENRHEIRTEIMGFVADYPNCTAIITSRPEDNFQDFVGFETYTINPLTINESYILLKKHDTTEPISEQLIKKLNLNENKGIKEYLKTPLLVSLLYSAFNYKHTIPLKKHLFYDQVFDAFFERHDLTKDGGYIHEKLSKLDSDQFERVLRLLGFDCMKSQSVEFEKQELEGIIDRSKRFMPDLAYKTSYFVDDLLHSVPLFCKDGPFLKWVHKSMQEYFAAKFVYIDTKMEQDKMLKTIYNSQKLPSYFNMLDIYYDIDNYGFQKNITLPLLQEYVDYYEQNYRDVPGIDSKYVKERIGLLFLIEVAIGSIKNRSDDMFETMSEWGRKHDFGFNSLHAYGIGSISMCNGFKSSPKRILLGLIYDKTPALFKNVEDFYLDRSPESFGRKEFRFINCVEDDSESEEMYKCCNFCLTFTDARSHTYLDYDEAKKEIERIKKNVQAREDTSLLTSGL